MRGDRGDFVPKHRGRNVFPNSHFFNRLVRFATLLSGRPAVRDIRGGYERTHHELLSDVLSLREAIASKLDPRVIESIYNGVEVYIALLAGGGYEFTVGMLAILALGAVAVPMTPALPAQEATYFIKKSSAVAVLSTKAASTLGNGLCDLIRKNGNRNFLNIPIFPSLFGPVVPIEEICISSDVYEDLNAPGVVIFTSGTTGPPKGSVASRAFTSDWAQSVADHYRLTPDDTLLHCLPVHHATGLGIMFFPFLLVGACMEYQSGGFDEVWLWERFREGALHPETKSLTFFSGVPTIYMRMMRHWQRTISKLPQTIQDEYRRGARMFRACLCGTSALPHPINDFWTEMLGNRRIVQRYGLTETGTAFMVQLDDENVPDNSAGTVTIGTTVKLSEGDEGEVLIKSPYMFSRYLSDPAATKAAHDENGFFKTGDIARREGKYYFIMGRASLDIIKSGGYKISALDVEREVLSLPYVGECMVVGVTDEEFGQRVAAAVTLRERDPDDNSPPLEQGRLTIHRLRNDLRARLTGYKMPTLLRVVEGELPKTLTGKVTKKTLGPALFPPDRWVQVPEVQKWVPPKERARL